MSENTVQQEEQIRVETDTARQRREERALVRSGRFFGTVCLLADIGRAIGWWYTSRWESVDDAKIDGHIPRSAPVSAVKQRTNFLQLSFFHLREEITERSNLAFKK